ncbi:RNA binding motif protein 12Bb [Labrus mixtus]|uniref:RNA binding motif protein 12Bb n=1 Tax=Labrus mixtus TaxID=508554 RepID=UPI0029C00B36|nr:RNA binding motif protein 12Bb [Labrus mixtus]
MAVVIRLQGLRTNAGSEDIRKFFTGLRIPDGGVHIIGGERNEAFIIFASDEDARRAMTRSQGVIKGSPVSLLLSSKTEMQNLLERSTKSAELDQKRRLEENARRARRSMDPEVGRRPVSRSDHTPPPQHQVASSSIDDLFLFLKGMPFSVTEEEVRDFFSGLVVDDIILFKNRKCLKSGKGIVKFATSQDAYEGLKRDRQYIQSRYVEVSRTTADDWCWAGGTLSLACNVDNFVRERSPIRHQRNPQHHARSQSPVTKRPSVSSDDEYCVLVDNLSYTVEKEDIKKLFCNANLEDGQILHLLDSDGRRTRSTFVLFRSLRDYCDALSNEKRLFENRWVYTRPISREKMINLLESQGMGDRPSSNSERFQERPPSQPRNGQSFRGSEVLVKCVSRSHMQQLGFEPSVMQEKTMQNPLPGEEQYSRRSSMASYCPGDTEYSDSRIPYDGDLQMGYAQAQINDEPFAVGSHDSRGRGSGIRGMQSLRVDGPTCVQLLNLPFQIRREEIYDFCYGYEIIPGSVSLQYEQSGRSKGSATAVFETRQEAQKAVEELSGRSIGPRRIQLLLV